MQPSQMIVVLGVFDFYWISDAFIVTLNAGGK